MSRGNIRALCEFFEMNPKDFGLEDEEYSTKDVLKYGSVNCNVDISKKVTIPIALSRKYKFYNKMESQRYMRDMGTQSNAIYADEAYEYNEKANEYNIVPEDYGSD